MRQRDMGAETKPFVTYADTDVHVGISTDLSSLTLMI